MNVSQTKPESGNQYRHPLVLAGAGHAHLVMMRYWRDQGYRPPEGTVMITPEHRAWYSGMMPGLIAGRFRLEQCAVDLNPWCHALGITLLRANIKSLHCQQRQLVLEDGTGLGYDVLSINTGSMTGLSADHDGSVLMIPAKPFPHFIEHWQHWQSTSPHTLMIAGGGAAAFELAMALRRRFPAIPLKVVCASVLLASHAAATRTLALECLQQQRIDCVQHTRITAIREGEVCSGSHSLGRPDALILATGAHCLPWYQTSGLACDHAGFLKINASLQSLSDPRVLVAGDAAALPDSQRSGVFSVRHGPVLANNVRALLEHSALEHYQPQAKALALLATADGGALMSYGNCGAGGKAVRPLLGRWKDHLDLGFMRRHAM